MIQPWTHFDWNQARAFLATAEHGSLSAAAAVLGQTQPTLSRQVAGLEADLKVLLFERIGKSLSLTQAGRDLLDHFRSMGAAAERISLVASGRSESIEGHVVLTASDVMATYFLPDFLKILIDHAPGITLEVNASDEIRDLRRREADIAIRHVRPEQPDLIAKLLGEAQAHFYATPDYLSRLGRLDTLADLSKLSMIGYGEPARMLTYLDGLGLPFTRDNFRYTTESGVAGWEMVKGGLGAGIMSEALGDRTPEVSAILPGIMPEITFPIWLVTHRELNTNRRIRLVFDLLSDYLRF